MQFVWDTGNISHIARHEITTDEAEQVIGNIPLDISRSLRNGEERIVHLGETDAGRVLFVIVTTQGEVLRVVTAYPADRKNRKLYALRKEAVDVEDLRDS